MSFGHDDIKLMEILMELGVDEIRAAYLMEKMTCPKCDSDLYPILVVEIPENKHINTAYLCRECNRDFFYNVTKKEWEANAPYGWAENIIGLNLRVPNGSKFPKISKTAKRVKQT